MKVLLVMASVCAALKAPATLQQRAAALGRSVAPVALALGCMVGGSAVAPANAADGRRVASISASGLVFKDKVVVDAFADPKVEGVTLYVSDFERPLAERMQKDFFSDPSQSGLACSRRAAPLKLGSLDASAEGEDVVAESKSLLFKTLRVKRIVDKDANALIYVAFSTRLDKGDDSNKARFASSLCTVPLDP